MPHYSTRFRVCQSFFKKNRKKLKKGLDKSNFACIISRIKAMASWSKFSLTPFSFSKQKSKQRGNDVLKQTVCRKARHTVGSVAPFLFMKRSNTTMITVSDYFGSLVFDDVIMKATLSDDVYRSLRKTIDEGAKLRKRRCKRRCGRNEGLGGRRTAPPISHTGSSRMTGITAEKHDSVSFPCTQRTAR